MDERFGGGGGGHEPSEQESGTSPEGIPPLGIALTGVLWVIAVGVLALTVFRSDPEPRREDPVRASLLPLSSCRTDDAGTVTCADPVPHVETVQIRTYPSLQDLYAAYVRDVEALTGRPFRGNVGDCSGSRSEGEVSWSLDRTKSRSFPLRLLRDGQMDPTTEAAGRVFCTSSGRQGTVIWTQDPFRLVTATGSPPKKVGKWWVDAHLVLACADESADCPG